MAGIYKPKYDIVLRDLFRDGESTIIQSLAPGAKLSALTVNFPRVRKVEHDLLFRVSPNRILHIEMQAKNIRDVHIRGIDYAIPLWKAFVCEILQQIIYLGNRPMRMPRKQVLGKHVLCRDIMDIRDFDADTLLASRFRADIVLAILAANGERRTAEILDRISRFPRGSREKAAAFLQELSGLRPNLSLILKKETTNMAISRADLNLKDNIFFQDALTEGRAEGRTEGIALGHREALTTILRHRFGKLPGWASQVVNAADSEQLLQWTVAASSAPSIAALLKPAKH
jgi:hypothetical protein